MKKIWCWFSHEDAPHWTTPWDGESRSWNPFNPKTDDVLKWVEEISDEHPQLMFFFYVEEDGV